MSLLFYGDKSSTRFHNHSVIALASQMWAHDTHGRRERRDHQTGWLLRDPAHTSTPTGKDEKETIHLSHRP